MPLTDDALAVLTDCFLAEATGQTFAPDPEWWPAAEEAREKGWLTRVLRDERVAYEPTPAGHAALNLNALRRNDPADLN